MVVIDKVVLITGRAFHKQDDENNSYDLSYWYGGDVNGERYEF